MSFAFVRLGKDSVSDIKKLDALKESPSAPILLKVKCKQVPAELAIGDFAFLCFGSDNDKGIPTEWGRGVRAFGKIADKSGGPNYNDTWEITIEVKVVLAETVSKKDLLAKVPSAFFWISDIPVLGIDTFSNQTVQLIRDSEPNQNVDALLYGLAVLLPSFRKDALKAYPELESRFNYVPPAPKSIKYDIPQEATSEATMQEEEEYQLDNDLSDEDEIWKKVKALVDQGSLGIILSGPPGTSKTWYARRIAAKLAAGKPSRVEFIQFHPSYSYDDFVEGYVPSSDGGAGKFNIQDKKFLKFCQLARKSPKDLHVLVVDELNRGDPSKIFGELLTYLESGYRGQLVSLAYSGRRISVPKNIIFLATINPYDKSVVDLDDAIERRFDRIALDPSVTILKTLLDKSGMSTELSGKVVNFFVDASRKTPRGIGHALFLGVKDEAGLKRLWEHKLRFIFEKMLRFEPEVLKEIDRGYSEILSKAAKA
jgi:hypothetical protein